MSVLMVMMASGNGSSCSRMGLAVLLRQCKRHGELVALSDEPLSTGGVAG